MKIIRIPGLYGPVSSLLFLISTVVASGLLLLGPLSVMIWHDKWLAILLTGLGTVCLFFLIFRISDQAKLLCKQPTVPPQSQSRLWRIGFFVLLGLELLTWAIISARNLPSDRPVFLICHSACAFLIVVRAVYLALTVHNDTLVMHGLVTGNETVARTN